MWVSVSGWSSPRCTTNQSLISRLVCKLEAGGSVQLARAFLFTKPTLPVSCTASTQHNRTQHEGQRPSIHITDHGIRAAFVWHYTSTANIRGSSRHSFSFIAWVWVFQQPHRPFTEERARDQKQTGIQSVRRSDTFEVSDSDWTVRARGLWLTSLWCALPWFARARRHGTRRLEYLLLAYFVRLGNL